MIKFNLKNIAIALAILCVVIVVLVAVDRSTQVSTKQTTYLKVCVLDLDGNPVHNAQVSVGGNSFYTDNKGLSPSIQLQNVTNSYDSTVTEWYTCTVTVKKDGFVPSVVFNCIVYSGDTRKLTVKVYPVDASQLPFVSYVESPPVDYVKNLLK